MKDRMIDKFIFLHHGGSITTVGGVSPGEGGALAGLIILGLLVLLVIGMWVYFTRKKGI